MIEHPWRTGKFTISAGLKPLGDQKVFVPEKNLQTYLDNMEATRLESPEKYYPHPVGVTPFEMQETARVLRRYLKRDLPGFNLDENKDSRDEVDLIISQLPEDFALWKKDDDKEWLALIHLSCPNHWAATEKIGKSFEASHLPIPHIAPISKAAPKLFDQIQNKGAFIRYAWGLATDTRLNHHPDAPKGRSFNLNAPELYVRLERQTIFPITEKINGFTIKTQFSDVTSMEAVDREKILECLVSMDQEILKYKGLVHDRDHIMSWLKSLN